MTRLAVAALALLALAVSGRAEPSWVKGEVRLSLRTGPGAEFRSLGTIVTGDSVQVLEHGDGWTRVRATEIGEGWIPAGFLQEEPPAAVRLERIETETAELRTQLESLSTRATELEAQNTRLGEQDTAQKQQIEQLSRENFELRAGARWPEWITGAGILFAGMLMGAIVHAVSGRRQRPRIRL
jgi:SH3 domain protein